MDGLSKKNRNVERVSVSIRVFILVLILLFLLFPLYWMIITSFKTNMEAYLFPPSLIPNRVVLDGYINLFTRNNEFFLYYGNNFLVSLSSALFTCGIAIFAGYSIARFSTRWSKMFIAILLFSQMFPIISRMISLYSMMSKMGIIDTRLGLIIAIVAAQVPFCCLLLSSFFANIPKEIEEAATVDGASRNTILFRLITPLVTPGILAVGIYAFLMTWDDYLHAATLIQSDALRTLSVGISLRYLGELSYDWSLINTISVIGTIPMVGVFFFFQRYMVTGLTAGAVKG